MKIWLWIAIATWSAPALAFPQLTRHGYFNCTACHLSPSGGGHLTEYGRGLSSELLSMWSKPGEEKSFYGLLPESEHLTVAGYLRALQLFTENKRAKDAKVILMQADLEAAVRTGPITAVGSVGRREIPKSGGGDQEQVFSRVHYLMYGTGSGLTARIGKFLPYWGINHPNHFLLVRRDLGFGDGTERDTAESSYLAETYSIFASHIFGPGGDSHAQSREKANTISVNKALGESDRIGAGWYNGYGLNDKRTIWNINGIIAWTKMLYSQFEADYQRTTLPEPNKGLVLTHQLGWEVTQGLTPYLETQWENLRMPDPTARVVSWGIGANWYPRPHWELQIFGGRESRAGQPTTIAYGMLNLYL